MGGFEKQAESTAGSGGGAWTGCQGRCHLWRLVQLRRLGYHTRRGGERQLVSGLAEHSSGMGSPSVRLPGACPSTSQSHSNLTAPRRNA